MADKGLFSRLQRLFSTDVIIRNTGGGQLKVLDINTIQQSGEFQTNSLIDRYNRIYTNSSTSLYGYQNSFNYQTLRPQLYSEYDAMDTDAIIASALDIIADESTLKMIWERYYLSAPLMKMFKKFYITYFMMF